MKINKKYKSWIYLLTGIALLSACKKTDVAPGDGQEAYINFYNASEALLQGGFTKGNMIYVNDSVPNEIFKRHPEFSENYDDFRQYPQSLFGNPNFGYNLAVPEGVGYDPIYWMPIASGNYRFIFTSVNKVYLQETPVSLTSKTFTTQYLVESPKADNEYSIVTVPVERKGMEGRVRIQFVNLSPDVGELEVIRADENGNPLVEASLPKNLPFGEFSSYAEIDTSGTSRTSNYIMLYFRKPGTTRALVTVGVPSIPYSSFTLTFQGFENETTRRIKTGENSYETITVKPNLRVNKRRIY